MSWSHALPWSSLNPCEDTPNPKAEGSEHPEGGTSSCKLPLHIETVLGGARTRVWNSLHYLPLSLLLDGIRIRLSVQDRRPEAAGSGHLTLSIHSRPAKRGWHCICLCIAWTSLWQRPLHGPVGGLTSRPPVLSSTSLISERPRSQGQGSHRRLSDTGRGSTARWVRASSRQRVFLGERVSPPSSQMVPRTLADLNALAGGDDTCQFVVRGVPCSPSGTAPEG